MLVKLELTDVHKLWPTIKRALNTIGTGMEEPESVLEAMLEGKVQCWLIMDGNGLIGFGTTLLGTKEPQGERILIIRDLYSLNGISAEVAKEAQKTIEVFARQNGCTEIIGYTDNKFAVAKARKLGYKISTIVVKEVK